MLEFFSVNLPTIIVGSVVFAVIALVVIKLVKDKIHHKGSCSCGRAHCPSESACHHK